MTLYDAIVFVVAIALAVVLALLAGCTQPGDSAMRTDLPYFTMDYTPAAPAAARPAADRSPVLIGRSAWAIPQTDRTWRYVVLHHSATESGNAAEFDQLHRQRGWDELGYHFVITNGRGGPDGQVQVGSRWRKQKHGAHTGQTPNNEYNEHGIGICLVGDFMDHSPTPAQLQSVQELTEYLSERYDIPPHRVVAHKDAPNQHTECCGRVFYRYLHSALRASLQQHYARR